MILRFQIFLSEISHGLWNSGGLIGRIIAIHIGLICVIVLGIIYLLKLTFTWAIRFVNLFLDELTIYLRRYANATNRASELLEEVVRNRVVFNIEKLNSKILDKEFIKDRMPLSNNWTNNLIKEFGFALFWGMSALFLLVTTLSGLGYFIVSYISEANKPNLLIAILLRCTIFLPVLIRMIRLKTLNFLSSEFLTFETPKTSKLRKRHILYIVIALIAIIIGISFYNNYKPQDSSYILFSTQTKNQNQEELDYSEKIHNEETSNNKISTETKTIIEIESKSKEESIVQKQGVISTESNFTIQKKVVAKYFEAIDSENWGLLDKLLPSSNIDYFNRKQSKSELRKYLFNYWKKVKNEKNTIDDSSFDIGQSGTNTFLHFNSQYVGLTGKKKIKKNNRYNMIINSDNKIIFVNCEQR